MTARTVYCPTSRLVGISRMHDVATIIDPQIIGLRGPNIRSSFSPRRMNSTIATA